MHYEVCLYLCFLGTTCLIASVEGTGNGDLRLIGGGSYYGRVEIYYDGQWGTVCDDSWDLADAEVVCRQLGLGPAVLALDDAYYGEGVGPIILDDVSCSGYEQRLDQCLTNGLYSHNCVHGEDAGVQCSTTFSPTTLYSWAMDGSVRLRDGLFPYEGRVEVYYNGAWGTVCDDDWDLDDASVVCRQLGYSSVIDAPGGAYFGEGYGSIVLDDVNCDGYESSLLECQSYTLNYHNCGHSEDAGVICSYDSVDDEYIREGSVRLMGSASENTGRVEIYHLGTWGTVCDDGWNLKDANVVCRQLGYPDGAYSADDSAYFGQGDGHIFLDDVYCTGKEHYLADCKHGGWLNHNCGHGEDAGVRCNIPVQYYPRLVNGTTWYEGRVEVWNVGHWEGVCASDFHLQEARTVCKQLGFSDVEEVYNNEKFGNSFNFVLSVYFSCGVYDTDLSICSQYPRGSYYCEATAIRCKHDEPLSGTAITLIIFAVLFFMGIALTCCIVVVCKQTSKRNGRSTPRVAVISGTNNLAGGQTTSTRSQQTTFIPQTNISDVGPPSYNEVVLNHAYNYPPVNINTSITPHPFPQGTAMQANFTVTSSFQMPPNPAFPNINPPSVVHPPPPTTNLNTNQQYNRQNHHILQSNDPAYPPNHHLSTMNAPSIP